MNIAVFLAGNTARIFTEYARGRAPGAGRRLAAANPLIICLGTNVFFATGPRRCRRGLAGLLGEWQATRCRGSGPASGGSTDAQISCAFQHRLRNRQPAGHQIRLEVSSSAFPKYDRNLNTGGPLATGPGLMRGNSKTGQQR
jgi:hypothetical protein